MNDAAFTTHFRTQTSTITKDGVSKEIIISELVIKNQDLLTLSLTDPKSSTILVAGKNSRLSDDKNTVIAEVSGYPVICQNINEDESVISVEIIPVINIADNKMLATLTLYPSIADVLPLEFNDILALCKEHQINYGIDELSIQESIEKLKHLLQSQYDIPIARGLLPVDGCDAFLRFEVEIGPLPGKILQDGTIDWRERRKFIGIEKGERIATKVPLTQGAAGRDIHGLPIPQKPGKDISVKVTGEVQYIEESSLVVATDSGVLSVVNETDIIVNAKQTIEGDVDFSVGNIESNNALAIKGDVKPGFTVICKGDLAIEGNINGATVKTKGNSKVEGGLSGEQAVLITDGDVEISFVERGTITCGGTVVITQGAYYANVSSKKMLMCRPDSKLVGGTFCSCLDFIGGTVGSDNATPTTIAAGVEVDRFQQQLKLRNSIRDQENELKNLVIMNGQEHTETAEYKKKESALEKRLTNLKRLNLIPNSQLYSGHDPNFNYCSAFIAIQGRIVAGTKIRIGNTKTTITEDATAIRFSIDRQTGHIIATPYTQGKS